METQGHPRPHWGLVLRAGGRVAPAQVGVGLTGWRCSPPSQVVASGGGHFKETPFKAVPRLKFPKGPVQANEIIKRLLVKWVYIEFACKAPAEPCALAGCFSMYVCLCLCSAECWRGRALFSWPQRFLVARP